MAILRTAVIEEAMAGIRIDGDVTTIPGILHPLLKRIQLFWRNQSVIRSARVHGKIYVNEGSTYGTVFGTRYTVRG